MKRLLVFLTCLVCALCASVPARTAEKTADPQPAPEQKRRFGRKKDRDGEK